MKKLITLLLACVLLTSTVYAASTIQAVLSSDITVRLNGNVLALKDAAGNPVYPISYNGTTYLPVRAVAESLNLDVKWNGSTRTIDLQKKNETTGQKTAYALNQWWEVPGQWKLKINSVTITSDRKPSSRYQPQEVIVIDYTYMNLGYKKDGEGLELEPETVLDGNRKAGEEYTVPSIEKDEPKEIPVSNIAENVKASYGLPSKGNGTVLIHFSEVDDQLNQQQAIFAVPITR